jgi:hypothetical protein
MSQFTHTQIAAIPSAALIDPIVVSAADPKTMLKLLRRTEQRGDCRVWTGGRATQGRYGILGHAGKIMLAHRLAFAAFFGELPEGSLKHESQSVEIHHRCHDRLCLNPHHLEAITRKQHNERHRGAQRSLESMTPLTSTIQ